MMASIADRLGNRLQLPYVYRSLFLTNLPGISFWSRNVQSKRLCMSDNWLKHFLKLTYAFI